MAKRLENIERIFVYLNAHRGISAKDAGGALGITHEIASLASIILHRGTKEELAQVMRGETSITVVGKLVRKRNKNETPEEAVSKKDRLKHRTAVYQQFSQAIQLLTGLPKPEDMAKIIKGLARGNTLDYLPRAVVYLAELRRELNKEN